MTSIVGLLVILCGTTFAQDQNVLHLAGQWRFELDPEARGESDQWFQRDLTDTIPLPGTTDLAGKGYPLRRETMDYGVPIVESDWPSKPAPPRADEAGHLVREFYYVGKAWYQRDFDSPERWRGKRIHLRLERVLWRSDVWVDDRYVGSADSLATPHEYDLGVLEPGPHRLSIRVDNALQCNIGIATHAVGPETQSQWNGIVGEIRLTPEAPVSVAATRVFPAADRRSVRLEIDLRNNTGAPWNGKLSCGIFPDAGETCGTLDAAAACEGATQHLTVTVPLTQPAIPWDESHIELYRAVVAINDGAPKSYTFGFRQFETKGHHILVNGKRVFLRGTVDCCVYPKTGHPPVTLEEWLRVFDILKKKGFNHVRFHTWCPPDAAFDAADRLGLYLQPETALWVDSWTMNTATHPKAPGRDPAVADFIQLEIRRISDAYGNHPSFAMFCIGNEFATEETDWTAVNTWLNNAQKYDPRHLYAASTARKTVEADQFRITHEVDSKPTRGMLSQNTNWDFSEAVNLSPLPVIAHETGQRAVFPDYRLLLPKFTGPLKPLNLERYRAALEKSGLADEASGFSGSSAAFQLVQYKAEHEAMLRTPEMAGYQLLSLNDFTGQSEALVGAFDPFWDEKYSGHDDEDTTCYGENIAAWNGATVPLARFDKYVWTSKEEFRATLEVAHYDSEDLDAPVTWRLEARSGLASLPNPIAQGELPAQHIPAGGLTRLGEIRVPLAALKEPVQLALTVRVGDRENSWNLWSYPSETIEPSQDLLITKSPDDALAALSDGRRVLFLAYGFTGANAAKSPFTSVYWSAGWWGNRFSHLGITGTLYQPALRLFPTQGYSDWQWYELAEGATTFCFTDAPAGFRPIVQLVPDFHFNSLLGQLFEARVGEGRLIVCGYDLDTRPAARQLRNSLLTYMQSDTFQPTCNFTPDQLRTLFN